MATQTLALTLAVALVGAASQNPVPAHAEPRHRPILTEGHVRILDVQIPPGDTSLFHIHSAPTLYVTISASANLIQVLGADWTGTTNAVAPPQAGASVGPPGRVFSVTTYQERPLTHRVNNIGGVLFRTIEISNNASPSQGETDHISGLPLTPEIVNPWFRVFRLKLEPGQSIPAHRHATPAVVVQHTPGRARVEGSRTMDLTEPGAVVWHDGEGPHGARNTGAGVVDLIEVELRGAGTR